ncbi:uncharacterized protein DNG_00060 [Cephalotrichum gorgonifer]|uniref:Uncharacterized protein n=1 Tax=Cephalotrichum gorgonifer TaxID=2041049 RepID=A0AAE8MQ45_9PEZI|nr:uncharacterized protein DNG_00060 [Cephalotrichum gorgonifer]
MFRRDILLALHSLLLCLLCLRGVHAATCYGVDGTESDDSHQPCNPNAEFSACCATNKDVPDICLSSGLCLSQHVQFKGFIYSNGCTDKTGMAAECPHICPDNTNDWNGGEKATTWNVLQCNPGTFCCRKHTDTNNCCGDKSKVITVDIGVMRISTAATSSDDDEAPTQTTESTPTQSGDGSSTRSGSGTGATQGTNTGTTGQCGAGLSGQAECPKNNTAVVGGAVGGALGAALLAALGAIAFLLMRRPKAAEGATYPTDETWKYAAAAPVAPTPAQELTAARGPYEIEGNNQHRVY